MATAFREPVGVARVGIVIPARYASTRYPGKPLVRLRGAGGAERSLIERSWNAAAAVTDIDGVWVATDDDRIAAEVERFGGRVVMTSADCRNGTERCAAAIAQMPDAPDIVVNLQGDAPLTPASVVTALVERMRGDRSLPVATPAIRCTPTIYRHLVADQAAGRVGGTTVVFDAGGDALYFSKRVIPYLPDDPYLRDDGADDVPVHLHLGVYAYRREALAAYAATPPSPLEQVEGLEQLRFLHARVRVAVVVCPAPDWDVIELNNPSDLAPVQAALQRSGLD